MNWDIYIFIAFCVFLLMVGMRIRRRWKNSKKQPEVKVNKNQRSKMATTEEPPLVRERRIRREKRIRFFTVAQLFVLFGLMIYMAPALVKDMMVPEVMNGPHFFLRCLIFVFTIYIFILGYLKVFNRRKKEKSE